MTKLTSRGKHAALLAGALVVIVAVAMTATPTLAAKGGKNAPQGTSTISLDQSNPYLGESVTFTTNAVGLAGSEWPMVAVGCSQGGSLAYLELATPSSAFVLGGNSSLWLQNGGPADCTATLYAYGWKGGQETIRTLASTPFSAAGS